MLYSVFRSVLKSAKRLVVCNERVMYFRRLDLSGDHANSLGQEVLKLFKTRLAGGRLVFLDALCTSTSPTSSLGRDSGPLLPELDMARNPTSIMLYGYYSKSMFKSHSYVLPSFVLLPPYYTDTRSSQIYNK